MLSFVSDVRRCIWFSIALGAPLHAQYDVELSGVLHWVWRCTKYGLHWVQHYICCGVAGTEQVPLVLISFFFYKSMIGAKCLYKVHASNKKMFSVSKAT